MKKLTSKIVITLVSASALSQSAPCINCVSSITKNSTRKSDRNNKATQQKLLKVATASVVVNDGLIPLDDNEEALEPIVTYDNIENKMIKIQGKVYACDDTEKLVCDDLKKVCECV
jgi:hypothetical protein